jgi:hypothetical protein
MPLTLSGTEGVSGINGTNATPANRGSDTNTGIVYGTDTVSVATNGTTAVTVDSSQNVGIGTASPNGYGSSYKVIQVNGTSGGLVQASSGTVVGEIQGDGVSSIVQVGARSNHPVTFKTNDTERARIDTSGNFLVGNSSSPSADKHILISDTTSNRGSVILQRQTAATSGVAGSIKAYNGSNIIVSYDMYADGANNSGGLQVYTWNAGAVAAGPYVSKGGTSWTSSSDIQLKDIDGELENALEKVKTIRSVYFTFKDDEAKTKRAGFIAQEIQNVLPEVVNTDRNGFLGVEYQTLTVLLSAAIKELSAKLDAAEARIAALEAK